MESIYNIYDFNHIYTWFYVFIFRKRGREGEREGEKHQRVVASHMSPTGDLACNPGMCLDWKLNWWPFGWQASIHSTEPRQTELKYILLIMLLQLFHFFPSLPPSTRYHPSLHPSPTLSSHPWIVHISFLASPFLTLFLTSLVYFVPTNYAS